jgi:hypothetical protein
MTKSPSATAIAENAAAVVRALTGVTDHAASSGLREPDDVYRVLDGLVDVTHELRQTTGHLVRFLERQLQSGHLAVEPESPISDPFAAVSSAAGLLDDAQLLAQQLWRALDHAQSVVAELFPTSPTRSH